VEAVDANVSEKTVTVHADPSVTPEMMLEKLQKVGTKENQVDHRASIGITFVDGNS